jgi:photosystem II stability/assembly factor-like uncharacterized protein
MKKFYILLVVSFLVNGAMAQWVQQNSGTTKNLNSVYFTDVNTGYAVGDSGTILKTNDGGLNWILQPVSTHQKLSTVIFIDVLTGYIVGDSGTIIKTTDGGSNWNIQMTDTTYTLTDIHFLSSNTGFIVGFIIRHLSRPDVMIGIVLKTIDGGSNWDSVFSSGTQLLSVDFPSVDTGYIAGWTGGLPAAALILKTIDGGSTWETDTYSHIWKFYSLLFINNVTGYWINATHNICKTLDGCETWEEHNIGEGYEIVKIYFNGMGLGYAVGNDGLSNNNGIILNTLDDGLNWSTQYSMPSNTFNSIYFPSTNIGFVVGDSGVILKTINGGYPLAIDDHQQITSALKLYPIPTSTTITIEIPIEGQLSIQNTSGQEFLQRAVTESTTTFDVSRFKSGVYFIKVMGLKGVQVRKFIKE